MREMVDTAGLQEQIDIDSAGTGAWHVGEPADGRSADKAREYDIELTSRARQFVREDFERFDYLLAMDASNYKNMQSLAPDAKAKAKVYMFRSFDPKSDDDASVPDPYYGAGDGFEAVFQICRDACAGLLEHIRKTDMTHQ